MWICPRLKAARVSEITLKRHTPIHQVVESHLQPFAASHQTRCEAEVQIAGEETGALSLRNTELVLFNIVSHFPSNPPRWVNSLSVCFERSGLLNTFAWRNESPTGFWHDCSACPEREACEESRAPSLSTLKALRRHGDAPKTASHAIPPKNYFPVQSAENINASRFELEWWSAPKHRGTSLRDRGETFFKAEGTCGYWFSWF